MNLSEEKELLVDLLLPNNSPVNYPETSKPLHHHRSHLLTLLSFQIKQPLQTCQALRVYLSISRVTFCFVGVFHEEVLEILAQPAHNGHGIYVGRVEQTAKIGIPFFCCKIPIKVGL